MEGIIGCVCPWGGGGGGGGGQEGKVSQIPPQRK